MQKTNKALILKVALVAILILVLIAGIIIMIAPKRAEAGTGYSEIKIKFNVADITDSVWAVDTGAEGTYICNFTNFIEFSIVHPNGGLIYGFTSDTITLNSRADSTINLNFTPQIKVTTRNADGSFQPGMVKHNVYAAYKEFKVNGSDSSDFYGDDYTFRWSGNGTGYRTKAATNTYNLSSNSFNLSYKILFEIYPRGTWDDKTQTDVKDVNFKIKFNISSDPAWTRNDMSISNIAEEKYGYIFLKNASAYNFITISPSYYWYSSTYRRTGVGAYFTVNSGSKINSLTLSTDYLSTNSVNTVRPYTWTGVGGENMYFIRDTRSPYVSNRAELEGWFTSAAASTLNTLASTTIASNKNCSLGATNQDVRFNFSAATTESTVTGSYVFTPYTVNATGLTIGTKQAAKNYTSGMELTESGEYTLTLMDKAGNSAVINFSILKTETFFNQQNIYNSYKLNSWYKVTLPSRVFTTQTKDIAGAYTFTDYDTALRFAVAKEMEFRVTTVPAGWVYISASNESVAQIYTDKAALDAVVLAYAKRYIAEEERLKNGSNNYYTPVNELLENDVSALTSQQHSYPGFLAEYSDYNLYLISQKFEFEKISKYTIAQTVTIQMIANDIQKIGGAPYTLPHNTRVGDFLKTQGNYIQGYYLVTERDDVGNKEQYVVYLDLQPPSLSATATYGNGDEKSLLFDEGYVNDYAGTFYYTQLELKSLADNIDDFYCIKIDGKNLSELYIQGEELPTLGGDLCGLFTIELYDRSFNTLRFDVVIADVEPYLTYTSLTNTTQCTVTITIPDKYNAITKLQMFKVTYDGEYVEILQDDDGNAVNFTQLSYKLKTGGKYVFVYDDLFGRHIETKPIFYLKGLPAGELNIKDGAITNKDVTIKYSAANSIIVYRYTANGRVEFTDYVAIYNHQSNAYTVTIPANDENSYRYLFFLYKADDMSLFVEYTFEIDTVISDVFILDNTGKALDFNIATNKPFYITWNEDVTLRYYTSNTAGGSISAVRYTKGQLLTQDGVYYFTRKDAVGNEDEFTITLKTRVQYSIAGDYVNAPGGKVISKNALTITVLEQCQFNVVSDNGYTIVNGGTLMYDGNYTITITDNFDNKVILVITIDTIPPDITLNGTTENGVTNSSVTATTSGAEQFFLTDKRGAVINDLGAGFTFTEPGNYRLLAIDLAGNERIVEFTIKIAVNYEGVINGMISSSPITLTFNDELKSLTVKKNGIEIIPLNKYSEVGTYEITAVDMAGNIEVIEFMIVPQRANVFELQLNGWQVEVIKDGENIAVANAVVLRIDESGKYKLIFRKGGVNFSFDIVIDTEKPTVDIVHESSYITVKVASKTLSAITLEKDGKIVEYKLGQRIEDIGSYKLTIVDDVGNVNYYEFSINYKPNAATVVLIVLGVAAVLAVGFIVIKARGRQKIK